MTYSDGKRPVALLTGAGGGLGCAVAMSLAKKGFDLVLTDLEDTETLRSLCTELAGLGARAHPLLQDIAKVQELSNLVDRAHGVFGRLDCLVNNAGVSVLSRGDILDIAPESFDRCIAVNLRAPFFLTQAFVKRLLADKRPGQAGQIRPCVITVTTVAIDDVIGKVLAEYSISKAGLSHSIKHFAVRLAAEGIDCYEVRPGMMKTSMTESSLSKYNALIASGCVPAYRWGDAEDVGGAISQLASGAFPYSVGQVISVDGGMRMKVF